MCAGNCHTGKGNESTHKPFGKKTKTIPLGHKVANVSKVWPCCNSWVKHCLGLTCHCFRKELRFLYLEKINKFFFPFKKIYLTFGESQS